MATEARAMLTLSYGCELRAGDVVRLLAGDFTSEQMRKKPPHSSKSAILREPADNFPAISTARI
jgi:hypothetical protein